VFTGPLFEDAFGVPGEDLSAGQGGGLDLGTGPAAASAGAYDGFTPVDTNAGSESFSLAGPPFPGESAGFAGAGAMSNPVTAEPSPAAGSGSNTAATHTSTTESAATLPISLPSAALAGRLGSLYGRTALLALVGLVMAPFLVRRVLLRAPQN
jgi:hypothetical protein